jgi:hypothetical protein
MVMLLAPIRVHQMQRRHNTLVLIIAHHPHHFLSLYLSLSLCVK